MTTIEVSTQEYDRIKKLMMGKKPPCLEDYREIFGQNDPRLDTIIICAHHQTPMNIAVKRNKKELAPA